RPAARRSRPSRGGTYTRSRPAASKAPAARVRVRCPGVRPTRRARRRRMTHVRGVGASLETLWSGPEPAASGSTRGRPMPGELRDRYGGLIEIPLRPDRPTVLVNFVSSLDGIVALGPGDQQGGGVISGFFEPDRFVMSILRSVA